MKKKLKDQFAPLVLTSALMLTAVSCGSDNDDDDDGSPQREEAGVEGFYRAKLTTLNPGVGGNNTTGDAIFRIEGDEIEVYMNVNGSPERVTHIQHIHAGTTCPTTAADTNADGFVDVVEGVPSYGPILVNLDGDLRSFAGSSMSFPTADGDGQYVYREKASFQEFLTDLRRTDDDTTDAIATLGAGEDLNLDARHVVVHGVPSSVNLPATVQSLGTVPPEATLPIACGTIERVGDNEEEAIRTLIEEEVEDESETGTADHGHSAN